MILSYHWQLCPVHTLVNSMVQCVLHIVYSRMCTVCCSLYWLLCSAWRCFVCFTLCALFVLYTALSCEHSLCTQLCHRTVCAACQTKCSPGLFVLPVIIVLSQFCLCLHLFLVCSQYCLLTTVTDLERVFSSILFVSFEPSRLLLSCSVALFPVSLLYKSYSKHP